MDQLNIIQTMSSREIAQLTRKRHDHVLRDIDKLNESYSRIGLPKVGEGTYTLPNITGNQQHREYRLTRVQTFDLMTGYNAELRIKVIRRWEELERRAVPIPSKKELAQMVIESEERAELAEKRLELAESTIQKQAPKVDYHDEVLVSQSTFTSTTIAKELGMGAPTLHKELNKRGIIYKQDGHWVLYHQFQHKGLAKTRTHPYPDANGNIKTSISLVWTEKGREWLHRKLNPQLQPA